jgi:hypothetical protein
LCYSFLFLDVVARCDNRQASRACLPQAYDDDDDDDDDLDDCDDAIYDVSGALVHTYFRIAIELS